MAGIIDYYDKYDGDYSTFDVAEKLGISAQTVRRMCEQEKFPGAIRTDGGHWRIPQQLLKTTKEQDQRADAALEQLDRKFTDTVGDGRV